MSLHTAGLEQEIQLPRLPPVTATSPGVNVQPKERAEKNKTQPPCMPLPPPPFTFTSQRYQAPALAVEKNIPCGGSNDTYLVDSNLGSSNRVKLLRAKEDRTAKKLSTRSVDLPKVSPEATPQGGTGTWTQGPHGTAG